MLRFVFVLIALVLGHRAHAQQHSTEHIRSCQLRDTTYFGGTFLTDREGWYGKHLRAMAEPPLCARRGAEVYRFLWLRTFHAPIAVRIQRQERNFILVGKQLGGAGGYDPGQLVRDTSFILTASQVSRVRELVPHARFPLDRTGSIIGLDGAQWIFEVVEDGQYEVFDRWSPGYRGKQSGYGALCLYFVQLSGLLPDSAAIY